MYILGYVCHVSKVVKRFVPYTLKRFDNERIKCWYQCVSCFLTIRWCDFLTTFTTIQTFKCFKLQYSRIL